LVPVVAQDFCFASHRDRTADIRKSLRYFHSGSHYPTPSAVLARRLLPAADKPPHELCAAVCRQEETYCDGRPNLIGGYTVNYLPWRPGPGVLSFE
jgi:hypothetical protein